MLFIPSRFVGAMAIFLVVANSARADLAEYLAKPEDSYAWELRQKIGVEKTKYEVVSAPASCNCDRV